MPATLLPLLHSGGQLFEKYVFSDWNALVFLMVLFLIDTALGMTRSWKQGRFHSRGMRQMFVKLREYAIGVIVAHVFCNIPIDGEMLTDAVPYLGKGVKGIIYLAILFIESKSIDENLRGMGGRGLPFPKFLRQGMTDWEETGQFRSKTPPEETAVPAEELAPTEAAPAPELAPST
ncbi:phage holin family protein [Hymenobacter sp. B81]|uniref:phage holin family protein n=1 Tax=Hymenobacter sp. B81 TaxID=3344878 RepID=UPI0037DD7D80